MKVSRLKPTYAAIFLGLSRSPLVVFLITKASGATPLFSFTLFRQKEPEQILSISERLMPISFNKWLFSL